MKGLTMRNFIFVLAAVCLLSSPAMAQAQFDASGRRVEPAEQAPMTLEQILPDINKSSVINGGQYVTSRKILERRVRDSEDKLAGEVRDVYIGSGGTLSALSVVFNRLRLNGTAELDLKADGVSGTEEDYKIALPASDIKTVFPQLMERTKTAPQPSAFSISKLLGADVVSTGGDEIGKLKEVLFDAKGEHADLAYLGVNFGPFKNKPVVVPFGVIDLQEKHSKPVLVMSSEDIETVFKFMSDKTKN
jgi:sporulation protein YlmC with PRC-barrel domain